MKLEVLGTGCSKCKKLLKLTEEVVKENAIDAEVVKVEDLKTIMGYGVMTTPALVKDGEVLFKGKVPSKKQIAEYLK